MQRARTISLPTYFTKLCPLENFDMEIITVTLPTFLWSYFPLYIFYVHLITLEHFEIFAKTWYKYKACTENKNCNLNYIFYRIKPFCNFHLENGVHFEAFKLLILGTNK